MVRRTVAPDGPFSQVPGAAAGRGGIRGPGGFGGGGGFGSGGGRGAGGAGGNFSTVSGNAEYDSRLNTDTFNGRGAAEYGGGDGEHFKDEYGAASSTNDASGSGGGQSSKSGASKKSQLLPMGIRREEHREPEVVVATTAELEAADAAAAAAAASSLEDSSDSDLFFENSGAAGDTAAAAAASNLDDDDQVWSRAIKTQGVKLVGADGEEIEVTDIDTLAEKRQELAAAAASRAAAAAGGSGAAIKKEDGDEEMLSLDSVSAQPASSSKAVAKKPKRSTLVKKDPEDVTIEEGLQAMLHDLAMDPPLAQTDLLPPTSLPGAEGTEEPQELKPPPAREGRLFLFQFPPVLPSLKSFEPSQDSSGSNSGSGSGAGGIKREPGMDDDVVMLDGVAPAPAPIDLTQNDGDKRSTPSDIGSGGFLGTLSIRQSGRAELSWGGMTYEMMPGTDVQFLTTAVLLEESDEKRKPGEGSGPALVGNAFGMGPVGGKYNLVPVFSEESEWTVDPSELVVEEEDEEEDEYAE